MKSGRTITIRVTRDGKWFMATNARLHINAQGRTLRSALLEFSTILGDLKAHWANTPDDKCDANGLRVKRMIQETLES